jgi:hypothetical protein
MQSGVDSFFDFCFSAAEACGGGDANEQGSGAHESEGSDDDDGCLDDARVASIHGHAEGDTEYDEGCSEQSPAGEFTEPEEHGSGIPGQ